MSVFQVLFSVFIGLLLAIPLKKFILRSPHPFYDFFEQVTALITVGVVYNVFGA